MASVIPPIKEHLSIKTTYHAIDKPNNNNNAKFKQATLKKNGQSPRQTDADSLQSKITKLENSNNNNNNTNTQKPKPPSSARTSNSAQMTRSTSANSLSKSTNSVKYYNKAIEYLKDQYNQTLEKLHEEVAQLKNENKKLNFKILVENEGGSDNIIRETLSETLKDLGKGRSHNISNDVLLNETIKELKVKLNITEDSNRHLNSTVRNLNKKMSLLKKLSNAGASTASFLENDGHGNFTKSSVSSSKANLKMRSLYLPTPPKSEQSLCDSASGGTSHSNRHQNFSYQQNQPHQHQPGPGPATNFRANNFTNFSASSHSKNFKGDRHSKSSIHNQYQEIMEEKERVILDLTRQNELQRSKLEELTELVKSYEKGLAAGYNSPKFGARRVGKGEKYDSCVLKSTASKVKLASRQIGQLGPINHVNQNPVTTTQLQSGSIAIHTSSSGTTTILPPLNINSNMTGSIQASQINLPLSNLEGENQHQHQHQHMNIETDQTQTQHQREDVSQGRIKTSSTSQSSIEQSLEGLPFTTTLSKNMPLPKNKTRIEINKMNQQRLDEAEGGHSYKNLKKNFDLDRGEDFE